MGAIQLRARDIVELRSHGEEVFLRAFGEQCGKYSRYGSEHREVFIDEVMSLIAKEVP